MLEFRNVSPDCYEVLFDHAVMAYIFKEYGAWYLGKFNWMPILHATDIHQLSVFISQLEAYPYGTE